METPAKLQSHRRTPSIKRHDSYPYRDQAFAPWPECDEPGKYCLISDRQGAVIRHSVSYVLWKYYEATGRHLLLFNTGNHANDAKNWVGDIGILRLNMKPKIRDNFLHYLYGNRDQREVGYYIGVNPHEGEFGQLYWYECIDPESGNVCASTYYVFRYVYLEIPLSELSKITWYLAN